VRASFVKPSEMKLLIAAGILFLTACGSAGSAGQPCPPLPADRTAAPTGCLSYSISPDARNYPTGVSRISFTVTATNVSTQGCAGPSNLVCGGPSLSVVDAAGHAVWIRKPPVVACPMLIRLLQPGESMSAKVDWQAPNLATGAYSVQSATGPDLGRSYFLVC
jgi:hypothetical protein